jgi:hypothetical protein
MVVPTTVPDGVQAICSTRHEASHPSSGAMLPSSHCSPGSTMPFPQAFARGPSVVLVVGGLVVLDVLVVVDDVVGRVVDVDAVVDVVLGRVVEVDAVVDVVDGRVVDVDAVVDVVDGRVVEVDVDVLAVAVVVVVARMVVEDVVDGVVLVVVLDVVEVVAAPLMNSSAPASQAMPCGRTFPSMSVVTASATPASIATLPVVRWRSGGVALTFAKRSAPVRPCASCVASVSQLPLPQRTWQPLTVPRTSPSIVTPLSAAVATMIPSALTPSTALSRTATLCAEVGIMIPVPGAAPVVLRAP